MWIMFLFPSPDGKFLVFLSARASVDSGAHGATGSLYWIDWPTNCKPCSSTKIIDGVSSLCCSLLMLNVMSLVWSIQIMRFIWAIMIIFFFFINGIGNTYMLQPCVNFILILSNICRFLLWTVLMMVSSQGSTVLVFLVNHGFLMDALWFYLPTSAAVKWYFL